MRPEELTIDVVTGFIKDKLSEVDNTTIYVAAYVHYIKQNNLYSPFYNDIYDYCAKCFDIQRRTVNFYIDVIEKCCDIHDISHLTDKELAKFDILHLYGKKAFYKDFNFSQIKAMLSLSIEEVQKLNITSSDSVHEIERKIKDYKKNYNKKTVEDINNTDVSAQEVPENKPEETAPEKIYDFSDKENNKTCLQNNYIPAASDYEIIFRNDNKTLIKEKKQMKSLVTAIKMLRTYIENNTEETYYYAVVKIPKGLD